jgi:hypothetical protein
VSQLVARPRKVGSRVAVYVWRVIAVDWSGQGHGTCGHRHASQICAVMCPWEPPGWDQMEWCDLLVRKVRA